MKNKVAIIAATVVVMSLNAQAQARKVQFTFVIPKVEVKNLGSDVNMLYMECRLLKRINGSYVGQNYTLEDIGSPNGNGDVNKGPVMIKVLVDRKNARDWSHGSCDLHVRLNDGKLYRLSIAHGGPFYYVKKCTPEDATYCQHLVKIYP